MLTVRSEIGSWRRSISLAAFLPGEWERGLLERHGDRPALEKAGLRARTDQFVSQPASALERLLPQGGHFFAAEPARNLAYYATKPKGRPGRFNGQPPLIVRVDRNGSAGSAQAPLRRLDEPSRDQQAGSHWLYSFVGNSLNANR